MKMCVGALRYQATRLHGCLAIRLLRVFQALVCSLYDGLFLLLSQIGNLISRLNIRGSSNLKDVDCIVYYGDVAQVVGM